MSRTSTYRRTGAIPFPSSTAMDVEPEEPSTVLFQMPITDEEIRTYRSPSTQAVFQPMNCATATAFFLGLLTPREAEALSTRSQTAELFSSGIGSVQAWGRELSTVSDADGSITGPIQVMQTGGQFPPLLPGHGTFVLKMNAANSFGHYFVIARDTAGALGILDPQLRQIWRDLDAYLNAGGLQGSGPFYYFALNEPRTPSQLASIASRLRAARGCRIARGGKTRRRKSTASSPPSAPKRLVPSVGGRRLRSGRRMRAYSKRKVGY